MRKKVCCGDRLSVAGFETLCELTKLENLQLGGCRDLQGSGMMPVSRLVNLTSLALSGCPQMHDAVLPAIFASMPRLQRLHMRNVRGPVLSNQLCAISTLQELRTLSLCQCGNLSTEELLSGENLAIQHEMLKSVCQLPMLESVQLWRDNAVCMSIGDVNALSTLSNIVRLSVNSCKVTNSFLNHVAQLRAIQTLEISDCSRVTDAGIQALSNLSCLQNLDLYETPGVGDVGLAYLSQCSQLLSFRMMSSAITDASIPVIASWRQLRNLSLEGSHGISNDGVRLLSALINLKILDLAGCKRITDEGLLPLAVMDGLRQLNLEGCRRITYDGVEKFKSRVVKAGPPGYGDSGSIIVFF
jgi:F-box and leucine-rich repeat protein 14